MRHWIVFVIVGFAAVAPGWGEGRTSLVETKYFYFYSDLDFNHHNFLYGLAQSGSDLTVEEQTCLNGLPVEDSAGWNDARRYYAEQMGQRHHRTDPIIRWMRFQFTGLDPDIDEPEGYEQVLEILAASKPAYVACFWTDHDSMNRRRALQQKEFLDQYGERIAHRLGSIYDTEWPQAVVVDLMKYSDNRGANTISGARMEVPHITLTSDPEHRMGAMAAFETLFHEASHHVFGFRHGYVAELIREAAEELDTRMPRDLWHAVSFYTTGFVLEEIMDDGADFQPYWRNTGLMQRAWPTYLEPIDTHWRAALEGTLDPQIAMTSVVSDIVR